MASIVWGLSFAGGDRERTVFAAGNEHGIGGLEKNAAGSQEMNLPP
jgi:hypothetical protein